ncbi:sensor histidine kinase YesM [Fusobacterium sp. PH5-7]|uniref:sensor histidine kinase n=1 Tax=Fusobacterium sp. PH5-7 TaxID=2940528 RepID=UPI0024745D70|nr:histidine kinase [Fusobacterium sp. PH5-7]MDH6458247.1 sensor histidine kinase YesM [Fusobacterium sp. PH5-7]
MKETYLQSYLIENYTLIAMVVGSYFVISMKSAVEIFIKKRIIINMTLLLILSIAEFYMNYLKNQAIIGLPLIIIGIIYYSLKPLVMAIGINIVEPKNKLIYIPVVVNFFFYCNAFLKNKVFYLGVDGSIELGFLGYAFIVTNWVYWIMLLLILNLKFYKNTEINHLQAFFCIAWLMTANIMESIGMKPGILNETYAVAFLFYYLVIHVHIPQQINEEKEVTLREQRMSLMLSQIQPHFLYNTLNTITALCRANPKLAEETTIKFSGYLRENMYNMGENDTQLFSKELEHTNVYLDIEKLRFGDRVNVEYDIKSDDFNMPTLTLQPIVENAVKHGICNKLEGGTIKISTEKKGRDHIITISDNGIGFEIEKVLSDGKSHVGIHNVKERLKNIVKAELEITSFIGIGTIVKIIIPGERKGIRLESGKRREIFSIGR